VSGKDAVVVFGSFGGYAASCQPSSVSRVEVLDYIIVALARDEEMPPGDTVVLDTDFSPSAAADEDRCVFDVPPSCAGAIITDLIKRCHCLTDGLGLNEPSQPLHLLLRKKAAEVTLKLPNFSQQFLFWRGVGRVSDLPVDGVADSARGQRPLQPADREVCPTVLTIMRIA
jgi:hypothetical protein